MPIEYTDKIERVLVTTSENKRTTVSLDGVMAQALEIKLGSNEKMVEWVRAQASYISNSPDFFEKKSTIGLSRLVQQRAIVMLANLN